MNNREKFLLNLFGIMVLATVVFFGAKFYLTTKSEYEDQQLAIHEEIGDLQDIVNDEAIWEVREKWMKENVLPTISDQQMRLTMSDLTTNPAGGISISEREFPEVDSNTHFDIARIRFQIKGTLDQALPWIQDKIVEDKVLALGYLKVTPETEADESGEVNMEVELHKYYAKNQ